MSGKAAGAYLTISEVSDKLDVPAHVLRFWETKFTQLKPLKRGGGRRYYREADVILLSRIRNLLYKDGFTIKGAQKALKSPDAGLQDAGLQDAGLQDAGVQDTGLQDAGGTSAVDGETSKNTGDSAPGNLSMQTEDGTGKIHAAITPDYAITELRTALQQASDKIDRLIAKLS